MLVLSRRTNERIVIDGQIFITVLAIEGDKIKLGIEAPRHIQVLRDELWQAIQEQNRIAEHLASEPEPDTIDLLRKFLADESSPQQPEEHAPPNDPPSTATGG